MSYNSTVLVQCEDFQEKLNSVWNNGTSLGVRDPIPYLTSLTSPSNRNGIELMISPGQGKVKTYNLTYFQRLLESTVEDASERGCDATPKYGNCVASYTIDTTDLINSGEKILAKDLARFCENNANYIAERLAYHFDVIDRKTATKSATQTALLLGGYSADAADAYTVTNDKLVVATKSSGDIVAGAWEQINSAASMSGFNGFIGFGGNLLDEYMRLTQNGCCANQGLNVLDLYNDFGFAFAYDRRLASALGSVSTQNLIMEPGALQLLDYTETPWKEGLDFSAGYVSQRMTTPAGVAVDVYMKDDCGSLSINVFANTKVVGLPDDMFATGDNYEGVTKVAGVTVTNS